MKIAAARFSRDLRRRSGVALLITLLLLSLITIIAVAFLGTMTWEMSASRRNYENERARSLAMLGMNSAVAQVRNGIGLWDNPFVNFTNAVPTYYWSVSPGIITRWSYTAAAPITNYPLFSAVTNTLVNLNALAGDGTYPIAGGANPPNISVYWVNVLKNPANTTPTAANPLIGRYAFWVDDENAKINLNTADGTQKYTTNSLGLGTPSEVDLRVLQQAGANLTTTMATNIVYQARTTGFNSPREVLRSTSSTPDLYTNNVFSVTTWGRSPDLNVWGEPKISLAPASPPGGAAGNLHSKDYHGFVRTNDITGQALTEIYPTPGQLPPFRVKDPTYATYPGATWTNGWRPIVMYHTTVNESGAGHQYQGDAFGFEIGLMSKYLSGTNGFGLPVTWPVFPYPSGSATLSGTSGLVGKYSWRQLDSLAFQIVDIAGKATTPESISSDTLLPGSDWGTFSVPFVYRGILSQQLVPGVGRTAKVNELYITAATSAAVGTAGALGYTPAQLKMSIYLELFFPAGFGGVDLLNLNNSLAPAVNIASGNYELGGTPGTTYSGGLNILDFPTETNGGNMANPVTGNYPAIYNRGAGQPYYPAQPYGYWTDTMLQNDAGIDFSGSRNDYVDPDQVRAAAYHYYLTNDTMAHATYFATNPTYFGSGPAALANTPLLRVWSLSQTTGTSPPGKTAWYPGQYRALINRNSYSPYVIAPGVTTVDFSGGIVVNGMIGAYSDPDPTPLEGSVRGIGGTTNILSGFTNGAWCDYDSEKMPALAWAVPPSQTNQTSMTANPTETVQARVMKSVIPVNFSMAVPTSALSTVTATYHAEVADPMVNKFPGDWVANANPSTISTLPINTTNNGWSFYYNGQNAAASTSTYKDPDSFWMPTLDPNIPRSARFPSIGYLQYLRTGVIPDDETVAMNLQHGFPYRCLNFNAVNDASQMGTVVSPFRTGSYYYPDWAILDLFTIPSTLIPYGGPYGYWNYNSGTGVSTWTAGALMSGNPTNMYNYGTWGGSTAGRINPNGSVVYTTNVNTPTPGITRTLPLQALVHGLLVNQTIASGQSAATATVNAPTFSGGTAVNDSTLASAIATYIAAYGPLREPAEISDIPAVSANVAVGFDANHNNPTRNDLVRQIVGNMTTQSNVFSVWVEGQSISKAKGNINFGVYETGDQITGTARYHFVVERYLEQGADGMIGNAVATSGTPVDSAAHTNALIDGDGIVGTYDDPVNTTYHPPNPRYLYRVVFAEEIRN